MFIHTQITSMFKTILFLSLSILLTVKSTAQTDTTKNTVLLEDGRVFEKVEKEAEFPGGTSAWIAYLQENLHADVPVKKKAPAGKYQVVVKFIVSKDGRIRDIAAETTHGFGMEKEVIRIIKKGPGWIPAMQNGKPVNAYRRQPITFVVEEE